VKKLALDFGTPENVSEDVMDPTKSSLFWKDIQDDLIKMHHTDVAELKQLAEIRDKALQPFDDLLPEKVSINEALENFETIKEAVSKLSVSSPKKTSRKVMIQTCREYINQSNTDERNLAGDSEAESIAELSGFSKNKTKKNSKQSDASKRKKRKTKNQRQPAQDEESGASEDEYRKITKRYGYTSQKFMQGIEAFGNCSEKLKKCYE
jgi:hypothetical protein